jgi:cell wall-active antibiotic response 4TMS protein YvqF/putative adhesin
MQVNRGFAFWGVALITAGAVALAIQAQLIPADQARGAWRLWPVLLIVIGLAVIAARTPFGLAATVAAALVAGGLAGTLVAGVPEGIGFGCGGETDEGVSTTGFFEDRGAVELNFDCGDLAVRTAPGNEWSVIARWSGDAEPQIADAADSLRVQAEGGGFPFGGEGRQEWEIVLPAEPTLDVSVEANAASSDLDLADANLASLALDANAGDVHLGLAGASVGELQVDANAGSVSMEADASTSLAGSVEMNAGSLELCVADDASVTITVESDNVTFSHNLDDSGLTRRGDTWSSGGADAELSLSVSGNAGSFTLNPEGGCD